MTHQTSQTPAEDGDDDRLRSLDEIRQWVGLLEIYGRWEALFASGPDGAAAVRAEIKAGADYCRRVLNASQVAL